jgi:hypothetical protein
VSLKCERASELELQLLLCNCDIGTALIFWDCLISDELMFETLHVTDGWMDGRTVTEGEKTHTHRIWDTVLDGFAFGWVCDPDDPELELQLLLCNCDLGTALIFVGLLDFRRMLRKIFLTQCMLSACLR